MKEVIYIFVGSGLGGLTRFGIGRWINTFHSHAFPLGTLLVNLLACFILGFVIGLADNKQLISVQARLFWVVGFCGGFSTFSTFSSETLTLLQTGNHLTNIAYIFSSIVLCLLFTFIGLLVANKI
jgi:fluoride exporter